jgi:hypothetical protein
MNAKPINTYEGFTFDLTGVSYMDGNRKVPTIKLRAWPIAGGKARWITMPQATYFGVIEPREAARAR